LLSFKPCISRLVYSILKINWFAKNDLQIVLILSKDKVYIDQSGNVYIDQSGNVYIDQSGNVYIDQSGNVYIDQSGNVYIDQSGNTKLVFKVFKYQDIYRLYNADDNFYLRKLSSAY
jgi:hypothetical protein